MEIIAYNRGEPMTIVAYRGVRKCIVASDETGGRSRIALVIGGSLGLSGEVIARADEAVSFSRLTFPHHLMRVILLEQIYRSFRIIRKEPYHK